MTICIGHKQASLQKIVTISNFNRKKMKLHAIGSILCLSNKLFLKLHVLLNMQTSILWLQGMVTLGVGPSLV
jgi:hypothetical protein